MRCKKHPTDLSSGVGVCASCLRERLLAIMAAQALKHDCRKIDPQLLYQHQMQTQQQPPPISFPRSVSPYISRRKSDYAEDKWHLGRRRFYSTPHVGPTGSVKLEIKEDGKRKGGRISSMFWGLFRSRSEKLDFDSVPISDDPCSESPSWFASIIPRRRKKEGRMFPAEGSGKGGRRRRNRRNRDRGMSPARFWEEVEEDAHCNGGSSGYSSESSQGWRQTPRRTPASARRGVAGRAAASSNYTSNLTFCLSPLVRASPNQRPQKGIPPEMVAPPGETRVSANSAAALFCKNRSRKLADLGRYNSNPTH